MSGNFQYFIKRNKYKLKTKALRIKQSGINPVVYSEGFSGL